MSRALRLRAFIPSAVMPAPAGMPAPAVIPAQAGIHPTTRKALDPGLRRDDAQWESLTVSPAKAGIHPATRKALDPGLRRDDAQGAVCREHRPHSAVIPAQAGIHSAKRDASDSRVRRDNAHAEGTQKRKCAAHARRLEARIAAWRARLGALLALRRYVVAAGTLLAAYGLGSSGYVHAKASLAQVLVRVAWDRSVALGAPVRPWPWADTYPIAMLEVPRLRERQYVLAGASGRTLAFGPALSTAAQRPGEPGRVVVSGHRDTHFAFLRELRAGDRVWLADVGGRHAYEVVGARIADARTQRLALGSDDARLALVTCWPFDAVVPGGSLRYVVEARLVASTAPAP